MEKPNISIDQDLLNNKIKDSAEFKEEIAVLMKKYGFKSYFISASDETIPCPDIELFGSCKGRHYGKMIAHGIKTKRYLLGMLEQVLDETISNTP